MRVWAGADGGHGGHSPGVPGDWVLLGDGIVLCGRLDEIVGIMGKTSAFLNVSSIAAIARSGNVVTVTTAGNMPVDLNGLTLTIAGVADRVTTAASR